VTFESPLGALVALVALVPLAMLAVSVRRSEHVAGVLGLERGPRRPAVVAAVLAALVFVLLGVAAAQPALRTTERVGVRTRSQVFYVVDVSRSMAAADAPGRPTRLDRARSVVARLHAAAPDVPSGLAGLTDRVLPYLFPTAGSTAFDETLARSVRIESPPPQQVATNATSFGALAALARDGFFDRGTTRRTCVVVTDGETKPYSSGTVANALGGDRGCRLVVVRIGNPGERVFGLGGRAEPGYAPDPAARGKAADLAASAGGRSFEEGDLGAAAAALRRDAEVGPERAAPGRETTRPLAPVAAIGSILLLLALAGLRLSRRALPMIRTFA
jgi:hypothetical protein